MKMENIYIKPNAQNKTSDSYKIIVNNYNTVKEQMTKQFEPSSELENDMILNPNLAEYIKNEYMKHVIDEFVNIYGQRYRPLIEERLNNLEIIIYNSPENIHYYCLKLLSQKRTELTVEFLESIGIFVPNEYRKDLNSLKKDESIDKTLEAYFGSSYNDITSTFTNIECFNSEAEEVLTSEDSSEYSKKAVINGRIKLLKYLGQEVKVDNYYEYIKSPESKAAFEDMKNKLAIRSEILNKYKAYNEQLRPYIEYEESERSRHDHLAKQGVIEFLNELGDIIPNEHKKLLVNIRMDALYDLSNIIQIYTLHDTNLQFSGKIEAFSEKSDRKLADPEVNEYEKNSIKDKRIKYFNTMGIDLKTKDFDSYLKDERVQKCIPTYETVNKIEEQRNKKYKEVRKKYINSNKEYCEIDKKVKKFELKYEEKDIISNMDSGVICIKPCIIQTPEGDKLKPFLFYSPLAALPQYKDLTLIHELTHVVEIMLKESYEKHSIVKCGFEDIELSNAQKNEEDTSKRPYELSSEVVAQMIAAIVTQRLHNKGIFLFETKDVAKSYGGTSYDNGKGIYRDFFIEFKDTILPARIESSIKPLLMKIGKENFAKLNDLTNDFFSIPGLIFALIAFYENEQPKNEKQKEILDKLKDIFKEKDTILEDMKKFNKLSGKDKVNEMDILR